MRTSQPATWHQRRTSSIATRLAHLPQAPDVVQFFRHVRSPARSSVLRAVTDGVAVTVTLKRRGVRPLLAGGRAPSTVYDPQRCLEVAAAVDAGLGVLPFAATCLRRTLTLFRELERLGLQATVHIGVRNVGRTVEAHAWVQSGDLVLNDEPEVIRTYTQIAAGDLERLLPLLR